uniref:C-type lectin domain-containing protein n=1 Tax=Pseudonaja textilis TaxID=8673 RepID=A0A670ZKX6_PSETE
YRTTDIQSWETLSLPTVVILSLLLLLLWLLLFLSFALVISLINKPTLNPDDSSPINKTTSNPDDCKRPCPTDWIGFQTKCFYFSNKEETWSASRDFCSLNNASLPVIDDKEMVRGENILLYCGWYQFHAGSTYISSASRESILYNMLIFILCWSVTIAKFEKKFGLIFIKEEHLSLSN